MTHARLKEYRLRARDLVQSLDHRLTWVLRHPLDIGAIAATEALLERVKTLLGEVRGRCEARRAATDDELLNQEVTQ